MIMLATLILLTACLPNPNILSPTPYTPPPPTPSSTSLTVNVMPNAKPWYNQLDGNYLVDGNGRTLYYYVRDTPGKSADNGVMLTDWPIFNPSAFIVPVALNVADFSTITRDDGQKIATFKGWPLYYSNKDKAPGDMTSDWYGERAHFVIKVPFFTVMLNNQTGYGKSGYLVNAKGMTLYYHPGDKTGKSTVTSEELANWPVFNPGTFIAPVQVNAVDFATITRDDGQKIATYNGVALYYSIKDKVPGDRFGYIDNTLHLVPPLTAGRRI
jgi:predicted lipoprotein with Yx(FWY)xxD motif